MSEDLTIREATVIGGCSLLAGTAICFSMWAFFAALILSIIVPLVVAVALEGTVPARNVKELENNWWLDRELPTSVKLDPEWAGRKRSIGGAVSEAMASGARLSFVTENEPNVERLEEILDMAFGLKPIPTIQAHQPLPKKPRPKYPPSPPIPRYSRKRQETQLQQLLAYQKAEKLKTEIMTLAQSNVGWKEVF